MLIYSAFLLALGCNNKPKEADTTGVVADSALLEEVITESIPDTAERDNTKVLEQTEKLVDPPDNTREKPAEKKKTTSGTPLPGDNSANYRLVVSFISQAAGIDRQLHPKFMELYKSYKPAVTAEVTPWGREGEVDYCFKLNELNSKQQKDFVQKVREAMGNTDMVYIKENAPCVHKR